LNFNILYTPFYNTTPTTYSMLCHSKETKLHTHRINNKQNEKQLKIFILQGFYISLKKARHILLVVIVRAKYNMYKKLTHIHKIKFRLMPAPVHSITCNKV
jgi:hypothetical protein